MPGAQSGHPPRTELHSPTRVQEAAGLESSPPCCAPHCELGCSGGPVLPVWDERTYCTAEARRNTNMPFHNSVYTWKRRPVYDLGKQQLEFKQSTNFAPGCPDSAPCVCEASTAQARQREARESFPPSSQPRVEKADLLSERGGRAGVEPTPAPALWKHHLLGREKEEQPVLSAASWNGFLFFFLPSCRRRRAIQ